EVEGDSVRPACSRHVDLCDCGYGRGATARVDYACAQDLERIAGAPQYHRRSVCADAEHAAGDAARPGRHEVEARHERVAGVRVADTVAGHAAARLVRAG